VTLSRRARTTLGLVVVIAGAAMLLDSALTLSWASVETSGANTHGYAMIAYSITSMKAPSGGRWLTGFAVAAIVLSTWVLIRYSRPKVRALVLLTECMAITAFASSFAAIERADHYALSGIVRTTYNKGSLLGILGALMAAAGAIYVMMVNRDATKSLEAAEVTSAS